MGKKRNDHEASSSQTVKDYKPRIRAPFLTPVAWVLYDNLQMCGC
jgi:hypothetical protein